MLYKPFHDALPLFGGRPHPIDIKVGAFAIERPPCPFTKRIIAEPSFGEWPLFFETSSDLQIKNKIFEFDMCIGP